MKMKHFIIEGFCDGEKKVNNLPCNNTFKMGTHCFKCLKFSYAEAPNEIAISNDDGIVESLEDFMGYGGDMEPSDELSRGICLKTWAEICRRKIQEAYCEYMKKGNI